MALANHRKKIRAEIARYAEHVREIQVDAITRVLKEHRVSRAVCPPAALAVVMASIARVLVGEQSLGMSKGHAQTIALVKRYIRQLDGLRKPHALRT